MRFFEIVSFHVAEFCIVIAVIFFSTIGAVPHWLRTYLPYFLVFGAILTVVAVSGLAKTYTPSRWRGAKTFVGSLVIFFGHLGPASAFWLIHKMQQAGTGSGLILFPSLVWGFVFYLVGIVLVFDRLQPKECQRKR